MALGRQANASGYRSTASGYMASANGTNSLAVGVKANAEKLAASMREEGFDASLHFQPHNGLTAVAMGGYATEEEARVALADARARGHEKAWLKRL